MVVEVCVAVVSFVVIVAALALFTLSVLEAFDEWRRA